MFQRLLLVTPVLIFSKVDLHFNACLGTSHFYCAILNICCNELYKYLNIFSKEQRKTAGTRDLRYKHMRYNAAPWTDQLFYSDE